MKTYRRLLSYVRPHWHVLTAAFAFMFLTSLFQASPLAMIVPLVDRIMADKLIVVPNYDHVPVFVTDLVNRINALPRLVVLDILIVVGLVMILLCSIFEYFYTYCMSNISHRVTRNLRSEIYDKLITMHFGFFANSRTGALVSRITYDTGIVRDAISEGVKDLLFQPVELFWNIAVLLVLRYVFSIPWIFVLIIAVVLPLIVYPVVRVGSMLKKFSKQGQEQMADMLSSLFDSLSGIRVVQAFGMEDYEKKRFRDTSQSYYRTMMRSISRMLLMRPLTEVVIVVCASAVAWLGGRYILNNGMSPGAFLAFLATLFALFRPFKRLSRLHSINQTALAAADRIFGILDAQSEIREPANPVHLGRIKDAIEYKNVWFGYETDRPVLKGVDLRIGVGEIVAIVGPSGVGKTTLVNLLPRFYDPQEGEVTVDGHSLRQVSLRSLRNQIGIVTQETVLFNDSVSANIAYGRAGISQDAIEQAARAANAYDFIRRLPNGFETGIGDRGFKLSGGEKQRIAIARALLKNPPILILDEATSALDAESEALVQKAIHNLMQGRTVLVIAHRLSTIKNATRIVVFQEGRIIEQGRHDELLVKNGFYKRIYQMQFEAMS